jgi:tetratricopeptide (TPR) repeat protein
LRARSGRLTGTTERICQACDELIATGSAVWRTLDATLQADVFDVAGDEAQAILFLKEALSLAEDTGIAWCIPEVLRRQSRIHRRNGALVEAEAVLRQAISVADTNGQQQWKLRSATELADLLQAQGRTAEARDLLEPTISWFSEGLLMPDLQRATALLKALGA